MSIKIRTQSLPNSCLHHDHGYHQLVIAYCGSADFEINGHGGQVDTFHGCLVPGSDVHSYQGIGDNSHIILDIPLQSVTSSVEQLFENARYFEVDLGLRYLLAYMHKETQIWEYYPEAAEGVTTGFLTSLHNRMFDRSKMSRIIRGRLDLVALDEFISQHLDEPLPTSRLAQVSNVSAGHFHQLFRQQSGMTPGQYLLNARMKQAHELLTTSQMTLVDIAYKVGFSSQSALNHAFRRFYGKTPGQFRRFTQDEGPS